MNLGDTEACALLGRLAPVDTEAQEVDSIVAAHGEDPGRRLAQRSLASWVTQIVHGEQGLAQAQDASAILFSGRSFEGFGARDLVVLFNDVPTTTVRSPGSDGSVA